MCETGGCACIRYLNLPAFGKTKTITLAGWKPLIGRKPPIMRLPCKRLPRHEQGRANSRKARRWQAEKLHGGGTRPPQKTAGRCQAETLEETGGVRCALTSRLRHRRLPPAASSSPFPSTHAKDSLNCVLTQLAAHAILFSFQKGTTSRRLRLNSAKNTSS